MKSSVLLRSSGWREARLIPGLLTLSTSFISKLSKRDYEPLVEEDNGQHHIGGRCEYQLAIFVTKAACPSYHHW